MEKADIIRKELIGQNVLVVASKNAANTGLAGKIINETKNMIVVRCKDNTVKRLIKSQIRIRIGNHVIDGSLIVARPEDRIKLKV